MAAKVTVGMVFHSFPEEIDEIKRYLEDTYGVDFVMIRSSWGRLWIKSEGEI